MPKARSWRQPHPSCPISCQRPTHPKRPPPITCRSLKGPTVRAAGPFFAASAYDFAVLLDKALPGALKAGKPGTPAFRTGLRDAFEQIGPTAMANGVMNFTKDDHWGHTTQSIVMLKVSGGDWKLEH